MLVVAAGRRLPAVVFAAVCMQITCQASAVSDHGFQASVLITNDGPTILGANTTFTAKLIWGNQAERKADATQKLPYVYFWEQHICGYYYPVKFEQNTTCNYTQTYTCEEDIGLHKVTLTVMNNTGFFFHPVDVWNSSTVQITEHINANLVILQASCNSTAGLETCDVVATNKSIGMAVDIHDPSNFFRGVTLLFHWEFGDGFSHTAINQNTISHKYKEPGHYRITVNMTAIFPDAKLTKRKPKTGDVKHNLKTMDEIKYLTIRGKSDLEAGTKASYNISCNASLPVTFCWYVIPTTTIITKKDHSDLLKCNKMVLTKRTWLVIDHKFSSSGGYSVGVYASNPVSNSQTHKNVHADSSTETITGLVIGILFGIGGCFLCIAVFTNYMRKQTKRHVEVANFDFQGQSRHRSTLGTKMRQFMFGGGREEMVPLSQDFSLNLSL